MVLTSETNIYMEQIRLRKEYEYQYHLLLKLIIVALLKIGVDLVIGNKCIE